MDGISRSELLTTEEEEAACETSEDEMEANDSLVVVGNRKNLPQIYVEDVSEKGTLRYRKESGGPSSGGSSSSSPSGEHFARPSPTYSTPGSYRPTSSYTDGYVSPLSQVDKDLLFPPSPDRGTGSKSARPYHRQQPASPTLATPTTNLNNNNNYVTPDSGYHGRSFTTASVSNNSRYDPFSNPDGTYIASDGDTSSVWEAVVSPVLSLKNKWRTRPSFVDDSRSSRWYKITPQQILGGIVFIVMIASFGFAILTYQRHMKGAKEVQDQQNAKYDSIQFGTANRVKRLQEEGRVPVEEVLDVEGNVLGGKKAAMQYGHDMRDKEEEDKKLEPLEEFLGIKEEMEKLASLLDQARENAMDSGEKDAAEDEQEKKQRLLEKVRNFGHFASTKVAPPKMEIGDEVVTDDAGESVEEAVGEAREKDNLTKLIEEVQEKTEKLIEKVSAKKSKNKNPLKEVAKKGSAVSKLKKNASKMTKEQPKESIDMDTDKDLSDAHEEKAKEASENLQKREADDKFRSAGTDDNGENNENFRFNRKKRTMAK